MNIGQLRACSPTTIGKHMYKPQWLLIVLIYVPQYPLKLQERGCGISYL